MICANEFFFIFATAIGGMPMPEICFLPRQLTGTILPKQRHGNSLSVGESDTQPSNWEADALIPLSYRRPGEISIANALVSGDAIWCAVRALLRNHRYEKKD